MKLQKGFCLRIFLGENDQYEGETLYEAILKKARKNKLAGCTILKGVAGFGRKSHLHTTHLLRFSEDLPLVIEIVDSEEKIQSFLPVLKEMIQEGLVTLEPISYLSLPQETLDSQKENS